MMRFGPGGIPLSCKGRTLRDSIMDLHHLGLTAMEVQLIKVNSASRDVLPEEIGKKPREILERLIIDVGEPGKGGYVAVPGFLDKPLTKKSRVTTLNWLMAKDYNGISTGRTLARSVDIKLTLHAPYYVDFLTSEESKVRTLNNFRWASVLASVMGADMLVGHMGFYGPNGPEASLDAILENMRSVRAWLDSLPGGQKVHLGIEPNGHPEVLGSKQEVLEIAKKIPRSVPVFNVPHLAVRENTIFDDRKALGALMDEFLALSRGELYVNFSGVEVQGPGSFRMTPVKRGMVKFENVAEVLVEKGLEATVISSSPLMEHDAMYLRLLYDRTLAKHFAKKKAEPAAKGGAKAPAKVAPAKAPAKPPVKAKKPLPKAKKSQPPKPKKAPPPKKAKTVKAKPVKRNAGAKHRK